MPKPLNGLTPKQKRFVEEYLKDLNATQAAIRAGYSEKTAAVIGCENLIKPNISACIAEKMEQRSQRTQITADRVLKELANIGLANMNDYAEWGPDGVTLKSSADMTPEMAAVVSEVSETVGEKGGSIKFKLHDKLGALEKIGRHFAMFTDKRSAEFGGEPSIEVREVVIERPEKKRTP